MSQTLVFATLGATLALFVWGRIRYDLVALLALLFLTIVGIIPAQLAFSGFAHPAVITVAAVLIVSKALQNSGAIIIIARLLYKTGKHQNMQIAVLCLVTAIASAFMNNTGALAILMPVAISLAKKGGYPPSHILMPVAFASILGGMMTLIGTPPNIIISTYMADETGQAFRMFHFLPVGGCLTLAGLLFVALIGWRFLPDREPNESDEYLYEIDNYITELVVTDRSAIIGLAPEQVQEKTRADVQLTGLIRNGHYLRDLPPTDTLQEGDILIVRATTAELKTFVVLTRTTFAGACPIPDNGKAGSANKGEREISEAEVIVEEGSLLVGKTASHVRMRSTFGVNLLAAARRNEEIHEHLSLLHFQPGDVLMLQGESSTLKKAIEAMRCLPLARRGVNIGKPKQIILSVSIFALAILAVMADLMPVEIAFMSAALLMVLTRQIPLSDFYTSIDWPIIFLLGAMLPVGMAFETSGAAAMVTGHITGLGADFPPWLLIGILMLLTTLLSNVVNNAATAVLMAPIAVNLADILHASSAPFLMAVAVAASCAFLTPIGHQSNTLVMRPAGYRFSDYWKMGLPVTLLVLALGIPLILYFWPM